MDAARGHRGSRRRRGPRSVLAAATCGLFVTAALVAAPAAHAATEQQTYVLTGSILIGPPPALTIPAGSTFTATVDLTTGAITDGHVSIPTFDRGAVSGPQANITITDAAPATGTLDLVTGAATLTSSYLVSLAIPSLSSVCQIGPVSVVTSTGGGGAPLAGNPPTATLTGAGFTTPAIIASPTCTDVNAGVVNGFLGLPTSETAMTITVVRAATPATTTTAAPAQPVAPTAAQPAFTG